MSLHSQFEKKISPRSGEKKSLGRSDLKKNLPHIVWENLYQKSPPDLGEKLTSESGGEILPHFGGKKKH